MSKCNCFTDKTISLLKLQTTTPFFVSNERYGKNKTYSGAMELILPRLKDNNPTRRGLWNGHQAGGGAFKACPYGPLGPIFLHRKG